MFCFRLRACIEAGYRVGCGFRVQVKVNKNRSMRYCATFSGLWLEYDPGLVCFPWPPTAPTPFRTRGPRPDHTGGGGGNATRLNVYDAMCACAPSAWSSFSACVQPWSHCVRQLARQEKSGKRDPTPHPTQGDILDHRPWRSGGPQST